MIFCEISKGGERRLEHTLRSSRGSGESDSARSLLRALLEPHNLHSHLNRVLAAAE